MDGMSLVAQQGGEDIAIGMGNGLVNAGQVMIETMADIGQIGADAYVAPFLNAVRSVSLMSGELMAPPSTGGFSQAQNTNNQTTDSRQYNLSVSTNKSMQTVGNEFASMQTLAGLT